MPDQKTGVDWNNTKTTTVQITADQRAELDVLQAYLTVVGLRPLNFRDVLHSVIAAGLSQFQPSITALSTQERGANGASSGVNDH